jgi:hypothetical protein
MKEPSAQPDSDDIAAEPDGDVVAAVQHAVASLHDVEAAPLSEHAPRYRAVHDTLQQALADTDLRESG